MSDTAASAEFDFVVIGGGSAGYGGASTAAKLGLRTAIIEGGEEVGGLCILRGCMPSKTFLESGHRALAIRRADEFGLHAQYQGADPVAIQARKQRLIADFAGYRQEQLETGPFTFYRGLARFLDAHTVEVKLRDGGTEIIRSRTFLLATGSTIRRVPVPGLEKTGYLDSDHVLASEKLPKSVIVLGAGPTAVEFASYYSGLGAQVTIIQRGEHVLKDVDVDVTDALAAAFKERGIQVQCCSTLQHVERVGDLKRVVYEVHGERHVVEAEEIVYSLGRIPCTEKVALENAGVALRSKEGGVQINPQQQTSVPHIFAAGDVCGPFEVVHIAIQQAEIAARNAARLLGRKPGELEIMDYRLKLFAVFSHPEVASVGLTEKEATAQGIAFIEAKYPFNDHGKSMVKGETHGFVKLLAAGPERKIIGGAVVGPDASELIHEIVVAMRFGATAEQLATTPHYHPTLSEIWTYPAEALASC